MLLLAAALILMPASAYGESNLDSDTGFEYTATLERIDYGESAASHDPIYSPYFDMPGPSLYSDYSETEMKVTEGDIYVSSSGNDISGDGTLESPYASIDRARLRVRELKSSGELPSDGIRVAIMAGTYNLSDTVRFTEEDSGSADCPITYAAYGDGDVLFKGSVSLSPDDFTSANGAVADRFPSGASDKIQMIDLKKYGVTSDMLALSQTGSVTGRGTNAEFFMNGQNFTLARYPNDGFLYSEKYVNKTGRAMLVMTPEDASHVEAWNSYENIWGLGLLMLDYQDSTSSLSFDLTNKVITFDNADTSGWTDHLPYFFFNVPEELDVPGEWYVDRNSCILYMYPTGELEDAQLELNIGMKSTLVRIDSCSYMTFEELNFAGTRGNGMEINNADNVNILRCDFNSIGGTAITGNGKNSIVRGCDISYTGKEGITWSGGDKNTMTKANVLIDNNRVTHWALYSRVFTSAISAGGQGITISHNEMAYSTSSATGFTGNLNCFEYNIVHDCTTYGSDCGAFYTGSSWTSGANHIRYNLFYNIGSDHARPSAIYWDDGMAYQYAYGNIIMNVSGYGFSIGGGFGNIVVNNIILNTGYAPYWYDGRPYYGYRTGDSFYALGSNGFIWKLYQNTPYRTQVWRENCPLLSQILQNADDIVAPHFGFNPAYSLFTDNIMINDRAEEGGIGVQQILYSPTYDNYVGDFSELSDIFVDPDNGNYTVRDDSFVRDLLPDFDDIPTHLIGRY